MQKALKIGLVALLGSSLSGCIAAAAAVPLLAGTGMVGSRVVDRGNDDVAKATIPRPPFDRPAAPPAIVPEPTPEAEPVAVVPEPAVQAGLTAGAGLIDPNAIETVETSELAVEVETSPVSAQPAPVEIAQVTPPPSAALSTPAPTPAPVPALAAAPTLTAAPGPEVTAPPGTMPPIQLTLPDGRRIAVSGGGAPAAALAQVPMQTSAASLPGVSSVIGASAYSGLYEFAMAQSEPMERGERRDSALLVAPGALQPSTSRCGVTQPAILIDLDPGDELLDPTARFAANPPLAQALASLRERNVSVHWISGNSAAFAGALRSRLAEAGLDPDGKDELVLMRYPDDRKQVRRRAVGATHCLVAIAGEERGDFDELYEYLRSPDAAIALEVLVGEGWFLIPPALVSKDEN